MAKCTASLFQTKGTMATATLQRYLSPLVPTSTGCEICDRKIGCVRLCSNTQGKICLCIQQRMSVSPQDCKRRSAPRMTASPMAAQHSL